MTDVIEGKKLPPPPAGSDLDLLWKAGADMGRIMLNVSGDGPRNIVPNVEIMKMIADKLTKAGYGLPSTLVSALHRAS